METKEQTARKELESSRRRSRPLERDERLENFERDQRV